MKFYLSGEPAKKLVLPAEYTQETWKKKCWADLGFDMESGAIEQLHRAEKICTHT